MAAAMGSRCWLPATSARPPTRMAACPPPAAHPATLAGMRGPPLPARCCSSTWAARTWSRWWPAFPAGSTLSWLSPQVRSHGRLLLYPGLAKAYRLADRPTWSYALPAPPVPLGAKRERKGRDSGGDDGEDRQPAGGDEAASGGRLAALVDLRGDGRAMLLLGVPGDQGHTVIVAVRRGADPPR